MLTFALQQKAVSYLQTSGQQMTQASIKHVSYSGKENTHTAMVVLHLSSFSNVTRKTVYKFHHYAFFCLYKKKNFVHTYTEKAKGDIKTQYSASFSSDDDDDDADDDDFGYVFGHSGWDFYMCVCVFIYCISFYNSFWC